MAAELLTIGRVAERTGLATSALRFYEAEGLVGSTRNGAGHRRFERSVIRRLSFIMTAQRLGFRLDEIKQHLETLGTLAAPNEEQWRRLAMQFGLVLDARIAELQRLRTKLDGCIGCGCLSLESCAIWNENDHAGRRGSGPRFVVEPV